MGWTGKYQRGRINQELGIHPAQTLRPSVALKQSHADSLDQILPYEAQVETVWDVLTQTAAVLFMFSFFFHSFSRQPASTVLFLQSPDSPAELA